ncbi:MAG: FAD-dependent oxidoreductase, partial [bacterium]
MHSADIVVLGGSAAGVTAAITARRHHPDKSILLVRKEKQVPIPCGIPYIYGTLGGPEKNLIPDAVLESNRIELVIAEVTRIDREQHRLIAGEDEVRYERLILATGSIPTQPRIPGVDLDGVFAILKDVEHLADLQQRLKQARNIVIIGGGFIGIEFADEINKIDSKSVTVLELAANCLSLSYDAEFCVEMEGLLRSRGVTVRTLATVAKIAGNGHVSSVELKDGTSVPADLVILGIGAKANVDLAKEAGLRLG